MSDHEASDHDQLEAALRQLTPAPPALSKDRLVYLAGQASGRRARWRLALLAAFLGIGSGMLGTYVGVRALMPAEVKTQVVVVHVRVPADVAPEPPEPDKNQTLPPSPPAPADRSPSPGLDAFFQFAAPPAQGYLHMRQQVIRWGVEALPAAAPSTITGPAPRPTSVMEMQSAMIGKASDF
jgi:hypothetical protein